MEKTYIGVDPGVAGFITAIFPNGTYEFYSIDENDDLDLHRIFKSIKERSWLVTAVIEDVHSIFGSSAKSTFTASSGLVPSPRSISVRLKAY